MTKSLSTSVSGLLQHSC